jgi:hypothetical protein
MAADTTGKRGAMSGAEADEVLSPATRRRQPSIPRLDVPLEDRVTWLEAEVGEEPRHGRGDPGSGLWRAIHDLTHVVNGMGQKLDELVRGLDADRAAKAAAAIDAAKIAAAAREPYSRAGWIVFTAIVGPVITALIGALIYWLSTLHH